MAFSVALFYRKGHHDRSQHILLRFQKSTLPGNCDTRYDPYFRNGQPMKLDKIYTRTGDEGKTSLGDGSRLPKFLLRVAAYGSIDEANSVIGIAALHIEDVNIRSLLEH